VPVYLFNRLVNDGDIVEAHPGFFVQAYEGLYHHETGFLGDRQDLVIEAEHLIV